MTVLWADDGIKSLQRLARYLQQFSDATASRMLIRIADRLDLVDGQAFQGRVVPEYELDDLREVIVQGYRVWYWVRGEDIEVIAIFHGARDTRG